MDRCFVGWVDWLKEGKVLYSGRETVVRARGRGREIKE